MSSTNELFQAGDLLDDLRRDIGSSEFGYRIQGLFAHVLICKGGKIIDIKPQGHPDIAAELGKRKLLLQVKAVHAKISRQGFTISPEDLQGIKPINKDETGYLAILECAAPVSWTLLDYSRMARQKLKPLNMVALRAMADAPLSAECTEEFVRIIIRNRGRLRDLGFHILCCRALKGEPL